MNPSIYERHTFLSTLCMGFFLVINTVGISQSCYQRFASISTLKTARGHWMQFTQPAREPVCLVFLFTRPASGCVHRIPRALTSMCGWWWELREGRRVSRTPAPLCGRLCFSPMNANTGRPSPPPPLDSTHRRQTAPCWNLKRLSGVPASDFTGLNIWSWPPHNSPGLWCPIRSYLPPKPDTFATPLV
ncbi:hypothetical protein GWK47_034518 [Chionoecetes opilio]|uniref:Uncharacterized protein n=1 Tax=Chionoecetes opilio TaxID=41210 RepID=A0A8J4YUU1_CHIOP|nr:hypothetical protein GWK47_034518 [Chionoecetes opilio]